MHNRDENKFNSEKYQFDKEKRGWDGKQEILFDCIGLENVRAGQGWNILPSVAVPWKHRGILLRNLQMGSFTCMKSGTLHTRWPTMVRGKIFL